MSDKLQKNRAIQRKYRDKKREKETEKQLLIDQLQAQLAQLQSEREALVQENAMLQNFARTSVGLLIPQPVGDEAAEKESRAVASIASYINAVNMYTGKQASAEDVTSISVESLFACTEQASVKQLAELLLDAETPEGAKKLETYVLACRKAGLVTLQCLTDKNLTKIRRVKLNYVRDDKRLAEVLKVMKLDPRQEVELIETCKAFLVTRSRIRAQCQQAVTLIMNCQLVSAPLISVEPAQDGELPEERDTMLHAADQFKRGLEEELESTAEWHRTSTQVLTPVQEARARVNAYPQSLSLWYVADYIERMKAKEAASLQVYHQWRADDPDVTDGLAVSPPQGQDSMTFGPELHDLETFLKDVAAPF